MSNLKCQHCGCRDRNVLPRNRFNAKVDAPRHGTEHECFLALKKRVRKLARERDEFINRILTRLDAIEERLRKIEYPVAPGPEQPGWQAAHGCVCPAGAERVCWSPLCPRKKWEITSGSGA